MSTNVLDDLQTESNGVGNSSSQGGKPQPQQVRLRITDQNMQTQYANAFRSNGTPEEVLLDFGINTVIGGARPEGAQGGAGSNLGGEIHFDVHSRIIMNFATTKRLAILLGNLVREHEARFGEVKLASSERTRAQTSDA